MTRREHCPAGYTARRRTGRPALLRHLCVLHIVLAVEGRDMPQRSRTRPPMAPQPNHRTDRYFSAILEIEREIRSRGAAGSADSVLISNQQANFPQGGLQVFDTKRFLAPGSKNPRPDFEGIKTGDIV